MLSSILEVARVWSVQRWFRRFERDVQARRPAKQFRRGVRLQVEQFEERCLLSTYLVTSLDDTNTPGTLRFAINEANTNNTGTAADPDLIQFSVSGTINVTGTPLPDLTAIAVVDATTAPGYSGTPVVTLDGTGAGLATDGLTISGGSSTVLGFAIVHFSGSGLRLETNGNNTVQANYIGINTAGASAANAANGILIDGSQGNFIGGTNSTQANVISGNGANGLLITNGSNFNTVSGNFIGTGIGGNTALGNAFDGVKIEGSDNNLIGRSNIDYFRADDVPTQPVTAWEGIRAADTDDEYLITGTSGDAGLLFEGTIAGVGTSNTVQFPGSLTTSVYGPDNLGGGNLRLVGNYKNSDFATAPVFSHGFLFEGTTGDLLNVNNYRTIDGPGAKFTYVHSTMGGLAVGNYDSPPDHGLGGVPLGPGHAFIYDIATDTFLDEVVFPGSVSNTAYGIWHNGGTSYTICGGYSTAVVNNFEDPTRPIGLGYLVDYDSSTGEFSNWASFEYPNGINFVTHFEGISSVEPGIYTLSADSVQAGTGDPVQGSWVTVSRRINGSFGEAEWVDLNFLGVNPSTFITSSNSVIGNQVVGIVAGQGMVFSFQATVNTGFQLSNVISGNGGNGVTLSAANDNVIAMNYIGTDVAGTVDLGNVGSGILVTNNSARNLIGGEATGGNDPTGGVFVRPPQGNLISGNDVYGVYLTEGATENQLSGNFVGTDAAGTAALGNALDGVAIVNADNNSLLGCTVQDDPFVYYNVVGGNGGNGLRVMDSDNTTIHANFFGLGADNSTPVGNALDGVLIGGTSANTQFGGIIPLGNVSAGNGRNGVEIADTASGTVVFNTFCGLPAFVVTAVGNQLDGMLITSTGGNNLIRTNVISGNFGNGVHIGGNATGVQLAEDIIGLDTLGNAPLPNGANGVLIDGNAHDNIIGGLQPSVIPESTISANGAHGIAIVGNTHSNQIFHSFIGTNVLGTAALGNAGAGIFIGGNSQDNILGGVGFFDHNLVSGNLGGGIQLSGNSQGTQIIGNRVGTNRNGLQPLGNHGNAIWIVSADNQVGGTDPDTGNVIAFSSQSGVVVDTGTGNSILGNSIFSNAAQGILLLSGGNANQPAPVLTRAIQPTASTVQLTGSLVAAANTTYRIEFFVSSSSVTPGQGQTFLGSLDATTNASGVATFVFNAPLPANAGSSFTATATDPTDNTSAFSAPFTFLDNVLQTVGTFDPATATWYLRNSNSPGAPDIEPFSYGAPGWISVVGDWNGDGTTTIGMVDPTTATWYLRNSNSPGAPDLAPFAYGAPGWIPVVGDWDGDGTTTVGMFDPTTATWYLRNSNSSGAPDFAPFAYGTGDWTPVAGDWDGNGSTTIGMFDPSSATWYLRNSNSSGAPDFTPFTYGAPGWEPVVGDWNGDAVVTVGVVDPSSATWYLRDSNSSGAPDVAPFSFGASSWTPHAGSWIGAPLGLRATGSGTSQTTAPLSGSALQATFQAALGRLAASRDSAAELLSAVRVQVAQLPAGYLGLANPAARLLQIDEDAAGHGWFLDPTPWADEEFSDSGRALPGGPAAGRMDLLTVVLHELGHLGGLDDAAGEGDDPWLMVGELATGVRRTAHLDAVFESMGG